jgi:hypothetical protein
MKCMVSGQFTAIALFLVCANAQKTFNRTSNTLLRGLNASLDDCRACSLQGDGLGPYVDQEGSTMVVAGLSFGILPWGQGEEANESNLKQKGNPALPKIRSLIFDLNEPVRSSGAVPLGRVKDQVGKVFVFWKHDHSDDPNVQETIHSFVDIPHRQTVDSTRVEFEFWLNDQPYVLQMGPWARGEFSQRARLSGEGTSQAKITRTTEASWTIEARKGSVGRLWNVNDPRRPVDKGLYYFDFKIVAATIPALGKASAKNLH